MRAKDPQLVRILFIGDIVGKSGRLALEDFLPQLVGRREIDFVMANAENAAGAAGLTPKVADELFAIGVDVLTSGNHIWKKREIEPYLENSRKVLRPANYPPGAPGRGYGLLRTSAGISVGVINLEGRVFMKPLDCPFRTADDIVEQLTEKASILIVDFHAEATSEKRALGWYLDGRVSAVIGTHTHVQTADEHISASGTAYITDVGMTGAINSVLGIRKDEAIAQLITQTPKRFLPAKGRRQLQAVIVDVSVEEGRAQAIERISKTDG